MTAKKASPRKRTPPKPVAPTDEPQTPEERYAAALNDQDKVAGRLRDRGHNNWLDRFNKKMRP